MRTSRFYILLLLAAVSTLLAACEPVSDGGRQVRFTASSGGSSMTKTQYDGENENGTYAIIAWGDTDKIRIYSPSTSSLQGSDGQTVDPTASGTPTEYNYVYADYGLTNITRSGHEDKANLDLSAGNANGLSWKTDGGSATFFGAYPSTTGISWYQGGLAFNVVVPGSQTITFDDSGVHTPDISSYSLLAMQTANNGEAVNLRFFPAFTAFEFHLKSKFDEITLNSVTLTTAANDAYMTGTCIYNPALEKKGGEEEFFIKNEKLYFFGSECSKSLTVAFPAETKITTNKEVSFTLFALPNDLSQMSITINCTVNGQTKDRKLNLKYSGGDWVTFPAGHKALITGLALDSGATWLLTINGEVLPWIYTEEETSFAQNVQSGPFVISNATETGNNYYPAGTKDYQVRTLDMSKDYGVTVVLDTNLTPELIEEGFVLEIISKIQTMRKDSGFEVMDHIHVYFSENEKLREIAAKNSDEISREVLARSISFGEVKGYTRDWNINGEDVTLGVEKEQA